MATVTSPQQVFDDSFEVLMEFEGYISDDAHDAGGLTKYGISQRAYPDLDIANLTLDDARTIYKRDYFHAAHCHELPSMLAAHVFDTAVNMGTRRAIRFAQRAVGAKPDGAFGPKTRAAVQAACAHRGEAEVINDFQSYRAVFYAQLAARKPSQKKFLRGWMRRTYRLQQFLMSRAAS